MKTSTLCFVFAVIISLGLNAQDLKPAFIIKKDVTGVGSTHNAHITYDSDKKFYYSCIGGVGAKDGVPNGKINKFSPDGEFVKSYSFKNFDMRSIMYNRKDKHLYIATKDMKIYKILDLENGTTQLVLEAKYKNPQSAIALDPDGKTFYAMDNGTLTIHKFKNGLVTKTLSGLSCGADNKENEDVPIGRFGSTAVAVDKDYIYTWDSHSGARKVYAYDKNGQFVKVFKITTGNYGFSLSYANGYIFVAIDGAGGPGVWNAYKLWDNK